MCSGGNQGWSSYNPMTEGAQHEELRTRGARDLTSQREGPLPPPPRVVAAGRIACRSRM
jgi:hypothetical protein